MHKHPGDADPSANPNPRAPCTSAFPSTTPSQTPTANLPTRLRTRLDGLIRSRWSGRRCGVRSVGACSDRRRGRTRSRGRHGDAAWRCGGGGRLDGDQCGWRGINVGRDLPARAPGGVELREPGAGEDLRVAAFGFGDPDVVDGWGLPVRLDGGEELRGVELLAVGHGDEGCKAIAQVCVVPGQSEGAWRVDVAGEGGQFVRSERCGEVGLEAAERAAVVGGA